jgi:hypothetical protein
MWALCDGVEKKIRGRFGGDWEAFYVWVWVWIGKSFLLEEVCGIVPKEGNNSERWVVLVFWLNGRKGLKYFEVLSVSSGLGYG